MNEQIKQRITQLNNGEVPSGYKKTEIGVFPTGWQTTTLDKLLDFKNGVNADKEKYSSDTGYCINYHAVYRIVYGSRGHK